MPTLECGSFVEYQNAHRAKNGMFGAIKSRFASGTIVVEPEGLSQEELNSDGSYQPRDLDAIPQLDKTDGELVLTLGSQDDLLCPMRTSYKRDCCCI